MIETIPVTSSNVKAIGYEPELRLLRIWYMDGSIYDFCDVSAELHQELMAAPSKGKFLASRLSHGFRLGSRKQTAEAPAQTAMLHTWAQDDCCARRISKAAGMKLLDTIASWECPNCGTIWEPDPKHPEVKHWIPKHSGFDILRHR